MCHGLIEVSRETCEFKHTKQPRSRELKESWTLIAKKGTFKKIFKKPLFSVSSGSMIRIKRVISPTYKWNINSEYTLLKINISPEKWCLEDDAFRFKIVPKIGGTFVHVLGV